MDLDIEMGEAEVAPDVQVDGISQADDILLSEEVEEPGEVADEHASADCDEGQALVPSKLHIRGVDTLHTDDIKAYVKAHFGPVQKIEWIDDASANLVFNDESTAREAITSLSAIEIADVTALTLGESLPAKAWDAKPDLSLHVRLALQKDKKQAGAALRSRYYLLHPEHDPEERRKKHYESKYRDRKEGHHRTSIRWRRASDDHVETFDSSMYDDVPRQRRSSQRSSSPDISTASHVTANYGKELFGNRGSRRNRSASPQRGSDNGTHMDALHRSSYQNKTVAKSIIKSRTPSTNSGKELFPIRTEKTSRLDQLEASIGSARLRDEDLPKVVTVSQTPSKGDFSIRGSASQTESKTSGFAIKGAASANARELFPDKLGTPNAGKELLGPAHTKQRQRAQDLFM